MSLNRSNKTIFKFIPLGHRVQKIPVTDETQTTFINKSKDAEKKDVTYRVFKKGPSWSFEDNSGIMVPAVEGEVLTAVLGDDGKPILQPLIDFLRDIWGTTVMNNLPPQLADPLRSKWLTQVTIMPVGIEEDAQIFMDALEANELLFDSNVAQAAAVGKATEEKSRMQQIMEFVMPALIGAFGMYFLVKQGII